jgi:hypothetical protein
MDGMMGDSGVFECLLLRGVTYMDGRESDGIVDRSQTVDGCRDDSEVVGATSRWEKHGLKS